MNTLESADLLGPTEPQTANPRNVDLLDLLLLMARSWRLIMMSSLGLFVASYLVSLLLPPSFTGLAVVLPPQQPQSSAAAIAGQLGALAGISGGGAASLLKNPGELYVGILESNTIADHLIEKFSLRSVYRTKTLVDTRAALKHHAVFEAEKNGLISITVTDSDPQRASNLANGYIDELHNLNSTIAITEAAQRRMFFLQQLDNEKSALAVAENDFKTMEQKTGLIQGGVQAEVIIHSIAELRAQITSREAELQSIKTFATDQNPDTIRMAQQIASLREQLAKLENSQNLQQPGDIFLPSGQVPEAALEYARKLREVKYHETLYDLLLKQYEAAQMDEARSAPLVQVVDRATVPDKKSGPHRLLIALGGAVMGLLLGIVWVLLWKGFQRMAERPESAAQLQQLRNVFRTKPNFAR